MFHTNDTEEPPDNSDKRSRQREFEKLDYGVSEVYMVLFDCMKKYVEQRESKTVGEVGLAFQ